MRFALLNILKCPSCGSNLKIESIYGQEKDELLHGSLSCECNQYPVIEGILNLASSPPMVFYYLSRKEIEKAASFLLTTDSYIERICDFLGGPLGKLGKNIALAKARSTYRRLTQRASFWEILGKNSSDLYFRHRFSTESLWSVYPFITPLKKFNQRVLDVGCGAGHASFLLSTYVPCKDLVCLDINFRLLYLAKKFMAKGAQFIRFDANYPLPFKDNSFSTVFSLDAFHYIRTRSRLAKEMERILNPNGLLLVLHLHNFLTRNFEAGYPLPPKAWIDLFQNLDIRALRENDLVEDFLHRDRLDLTKECSLNELNSANAISIVGTKDKSLFKVYEGVESSFLEKKSNLIINPVYRVQHEANMIILDKRPISSKGRHTWDFWEEYSLSKKHLPDRFIIKGDLSKEFTNRNLNLDLGSASSKILKQVDTLIKKFVLINVPMNYIYSTRSSQNTS